MMGQRMHLGPGKIMAEFAVLNYIFDDMRRIRAQFKLYLRISCQCLWLNNIPYGVNLRHRWGHGD